MKLPVVKTLANYACTTSLLNTARRPNVMESNKLSDEEISTKLQELGQECAEFVHWQATTQVELDELITHLMSRRQEVKAAQLKRLDLEAEELLNKLRAIETQKLIEEVRCFKEVLSFQQYLLQKYDDY